MPHIPSKTITSDRPGVTHLWRVGTDRIELSRSASCWKARVWREVWGGVLLQIDGRYFDGEAEAAAWCEKMAKVMAEDLEDDIDYD